MKKTLLIGNFGSGNIGDELILSYSLEKHAKKDCFVMTHDRVFSQEFTNKKFETIDFFSTGFRSFISFVFSKERKKGVLSLRSELGEVVFCGGGLFAIKFRAVVLWWMVWLWCRFLFRGVKIKFEYQGVDNDLGVLSRFLIKRAFLSADTISVRDASSGEALKALGIENYEVLEDIVYLNLKNTVDDTLLEKRSIVLLNALSVVSDEKFESIKSKFPKYEFVFLCFDPKDKLFVPSGCRVILPKTKEALFALFASAEFCVGERLHFLILGNAFCHEKNVFMLNKPYSEKVNSFCEKVGICVFK